MVLVFCAIPDIIVHYYTKACLPIIGYAAIVYQKASMTNLYPPTVIHSRLSRFTLACSLFSSQVTLEMPVSPEVNMIY